jgi:RNA polymerase sigma-70 factor (ECF subfamily)
VVDGGAGVPTTPAPLDFDYVFRTYSPYVARIALRVLGRRDEVEDLVQDVFLQAHRKLATLEEPGAIRGWLATTTVRMSSRRLRRRRMLRFIGLDGSHDYENVADGGASPHERALLAQIYRLLDEMPVEERTAWTLRMIEREPIERVADLLGISESTAKRRIRAGQEAIERGVRDA